MRPVPSRERTVERAVIASFGLATVAGVALMVTYWRGGQPQLEGLFLGVALGGIGVGLVLWANGLLAGTHVEHRAALVATQEETEALQRDLEHGGVLHRRAAAPPRASRRGWCARARRPLPHPIAGSAPRTHLAAHGLGVGSGASSRSTANRFDPKMSPSGDC